MHIGDKQPSILRTVYTPEAGGFRHKVFECLNPNPNKNAQLGCITHVCRLV